MILSVYRGLSYAAAPVLRRFLERRKQRGKEDPIRIEERFGNPSQKRPPEPSSGFMPPASVRPFPFSL